MQMAGLQPAEGMDGVPQGAFIIPAGAVVMMPAGAVPVQYVAANGRAVASTSSEPESERMPEEGRFAL
jgi:hypothetical protein